MALTDIMVALAAIQQRISADHPRHLVILNSVSSILMCVKISIVAKFVQLLIAKARAAGGQVITTMETGMHEEQVTRTIEHLVDDIIEISHENGKLRYFSTRKQQVMEGISA
jgi:hypothetical protein